MIRTPKATRLLRLRTDLPSATAYLAEQAAGRRRQTQVKRLEQMRIPIVTFSTGYGSTAVEIDAELLRAAEATLEAEERQALIAEEAKREPEPAEKPARTLVGLLGTRASGFFA